MTTTLTATITCTGTLHLRMPERADALIGILEVHAEWNDPTSLKLRAWALDSFQSMESAPEGELTNRLRERVGILDREILVSSLDGAPLRKAPYLIDGEHILPEDVFDNVYHVAKQAAREESPFNKKPMMFRQKFHAFAAAVLQWRGVECGQTSPTDAVPLLATREAKCQYLEYREAARGSEDNQLTNFFLASAERTRAQTAQLQNHYEDANLRMNQQAQQQLREMSETQDRVVRQYNAMRNDLTARLEAGERDIVELRHQLSDAEMAHGELSRQVVELQSRIRAAEEEIARMRAELDEDDSRCVIS